MSLDDLIEALRRRAVSQEAPRARVLFELEPAGTLLLDGTRSPPEITPGGDEADTTVTMTAGDFAEVMEGRLDPTIAFMTGRLKVRGDMGVAMKLPGLLGD